VHAMIEKSTPETIATCACDRPLCSEYSGSTGPKLRSTNCSPKITTIIRMKFWNASTLRNVTRPRSAGSAVLGVRGVFVVHHVHQHQTNRVEHGRREKRAPQREHARQHAANQRTDARTDPLRSLHEPDRRRHPVARPPTRRPWRPTTIRSGEQSLHGAYRQHLHARVTLVHRRKQHDEADEATARP